MSSKTFLRWAGSKKRLIPKLSPYWGVGFRRYIEPFMGSAALFFALEPREAILSDINEELVETLCTVRDHPRAVYNRLIKLPKGESTYYRLRRLRSYELSTLDHAARFIYLNRFCFNGIYRTNQEGMFNVPYSSAKTGVLPTSSDLWKAAKLLSNAKIFARDFEATLSEVEEGDFVYMDPPFAVENRRIFRQYGPDTFGKDDLRRLAALLPAIDRAGATFVVSYALCSEALRAFRRWPIKRVRTQRSIAGFSEHRRNAVEILVSNRFLSEED